jgi:hypothetical protein
MGFDADVVEDLPTYEDLEYTPERVARYSQGEQPLKSDFCHRLRAWKR